MTSSEWLGLSPGWAMKVLVADDSPISRHLLENFLRQWGYEVISVADGEQAWEVLQQEDAPRLVILDWVMPGLSGPEICRRVRQQSGRQYTYILLVTSKGEKSDVIEGLEAGADDYLTKPVHQNELRVRLGAGRRILELQDALLQAQAELREQALRDPLTKLWNRRGILELLEKELARTERGHGPLGVVIADLDHFKRVNDTYGHITGDGVLKGAAERMMRHSRSYDSLGRYGGEEFLVLLPGCELGDAEKQAERLRRALAEEPLAVGEQLIPITSSFGVTSTPSGTRASVEDVLRVADAALYTAKEQGRNRVVALPLSRPHL